MILERVMFANDVGYCISNFLGYRWSIDGHSVEINNSSAPDIGLFYASDALSVIPQNKHETGAISYTLKMLIPRVYRWDCSITQVQLTV